MQACADNMAGRESPNEAPQHSPLATLRKLNIDLPEYPASLERFRDKIVADYNELCGVDVMKDAEEQSYFAWVTYAAMGNAEAAYGFKRLSEILRSIQGRYNPRGNDEIPGPPRQPLDYLETRCETIISRWLEDMNIWEARSRHNVKYISTEYEVKLAQFCKAREKFDVHLQLLEYYMKEYSGVQKGADPTPAWECVLGLRPTLATIEEGLRSCVKKIKEKANDNGNESVPESNLTGTGLNSSIKISTLQKTEPSKTNHDLGSLPSKHRDYTVGWICALPTEMAAAVGMLDSRHDNLGQPSHDDNIYTLGRIGSHNVAIACLPAGVTGTNSAAIVATRMLSTFPSLRFGLMVGVGGGVPSPENDIRLGDVVVSKPGGTSGGVIQYDFGKTVQAGRFVRTGSLNRPPDVLLNAIAFLQSKHMMEDSELSKYLLEIVLKYPKLRGTVTYQGMEFDILFAAEYGHQEGDVGCTRCDINRLISRSDRNGTDPVIHYGLIASGNQVMRDGSCRDRLRKELNVLCFEMEAAGLMDNFPCLVIRGVCDYADSHKNKRWQAYAATTAAAYAKELLYVVPQSGVIETPSVVEGMKKTGEFPGQ